LWRNGGLVEVCEEEDKLYVSSTYAVAGRQVGICTHDGKVLFARVSTRCKMLSEFPAGREPPAGTEWKREMMEYAQKNAK